MVGRLLLMISIIFLSTNLALAQKEPPHITLGIETYFLIGGETNASFNFLTGLRGTYVFHRKARFDFFSSGGFATDIFNPDSRLLTADAQVGFHWQNHKKLSWMVSIGGNYLQESHSLFLSDGKRNWQQSSWGFTGQIGTNFRLSEPLSSTVFVKQINLTFTSIGIGLNYTF